ncbi:DUF488 family protein [Streptomyces scopuliridis]|uniref:DUF488 family protein n=1 Tax=Streptomyces scopuliridis TaxID=452529 RepID=UPI0036AA02D4
MSLVADVRLTPISRKPGFSKTRLPHALDEAGITYTHLRALGNPKDNRAPSGKGGSARAERTSAACCAPTQPRPTLNSSRNTQLGPGSPAARPGPGPSPSVSPTRPPCVQCSNHRGDARPWCPSVILPGRDQVSCQTGHTGAYTKFRTVPITVVANREGGCLAGYGIEQIYEQHVLESGLVVLNITAATEKTSHREQWRVGPRPVWL